MNSFIHLFYKIEWNNIYKKQANLLQFSNILTLNKKMYKNMNENDIYYR